MDTNVKELVSAFRSLRAHRCELSQRRLALQAVSDSAKHTHRALLRDGAVPKEIGAAREKMNALSVDLVGLNEVDLDCATELKAAALAARGAMGQRCATLKAAIDSAVSESKELHLCAIAELFAQLAPHLEALGDVIGKNRESGVFHLWSNLRFCLEKRTEQFMQSTKASEAFLKRLADTRAEPVVGVSELEVELNNTIAEMRSFESETKDIFDAAEISTAPSQPTASLPGINAPSVYSR